MSVATESSESGLLHGDLREISTAVSGDLKQSPQAFSRNASWRLQAGIATAIGLRPTNEDCGYANVRDGLFLVADGVGGQFGGAVASQLLVDVIPPLLLPTLQRSDVANDELDEPIRRAVCAAQTAMDELAIREPGLEKMGSTIALGVVAGKKLYMTHLGDSRIYLVRNGILKQLTKDHSFVQTLMDAGQLSPSEAKKHPWHTVITELVGAKWHSRATVVSHELLAGDRLLFATDGLTDVVDEEMLAWTITNLSNPQHAADVLVHQALECGSRDNVTGLVVHIDPTQGRLFKKRCRIALHQSFTVGSVK